MLDGIGSQLGGRRELGGVGRELGGRRELGGDRLGAGRNRC